MSNFPRATSKFLTAAQQAAILKSVQPHSTVRFPSPGVLDWRAVVQPTPLSDWYKIKIVYHQDRTTLPRVWVMDPALQLRDGKLPPHLYREGNLCIFLPGANEWDSSKPIALTILSWTSLWLYFYELWLATGQWYGGGEHPPPKVETETESRVDELAKRRPSGGTGKTGRY